ncbi:PREDICTED: uncharacterized protein LOC108372585 [Rhagoletis zephyria]|uniref:uncharacterized protein LOC108372585 n=1 Tax=Rhagoletis zephyria TaxID=28612 RepID=UPI0008115831|nr:PREDICTED: uncharacterized protein LOC108372585 [Rhagoletis zephyria]
MEMQGILQNNINVSGKFVAVEIRALVCDAPARAFVCGTPSHVSSHGCGKCTQIGRKLNNVLVYSSEPGELLTDDDFLRRKYAGHHNKKFRNTMTPLENIGVKMITQIALDSMHLLDLGVMRKFLLRLLQDKVNVKVEKIKKKNMSEILKSLSPFITKEFVRKPRSMDEILNWKATEFRQVLLYTGILIFKDNVRDVGYFFAPNLT